MLEFIGRENEVLQLKQLLIGEEDIKIEEVVEVVEEETKIEHPLLPLLYIHGKTGTGKTTIVKEILEDFGRAYSFVNCHDCFTLSLLFSHTLKQLGDVYGKLNKGETTPRKRKNGKLESVAKKVKTEEKTDESKKVKKSKGKGKSKNKEEREEDNEVEVEIEIEDEPKIYIEIEKSLDDDGDIFEMLNKTKYPKCEKIEEFVNQVRDLSDKIKQPLYLV